MNPKKIKMFSVAAAFMMSATIGTVLANAESPDSAPLANVVSSAEVEAEMSSYNASSTYTSGDYKYTINSNATIGSSEDETITITITDYTGSDTDLVIPGTIDGYKVTEIGYGAFEDCTSLKSVVIPEGVTCIATEAFEGCTNLKSITIPDSVTSIGGDAFIRCKSLTSVSLPNSINYIGFRTFAYCSNLTSITLPDNVNVIEDGAFSGCDNLTSISVDENNANYKSVDGILFNKNMTELNAFPSGKGGEYIIPDSVTTIADYAFSYCEGLTNITIPDGVISIGGSAFFECYKLTSIVIPDSVKYIGNHAFDACLSLTSIVIPDGVTSIELATFQSCSKLKSVTIPDSVTSIEEYAFNGCGLISINISDNIKSIGNAAFGGCGALTSVTIPDSVTSIGEMAFYNSFNLISINVDENNANYKSVDGVLFTKDMTEIVAFPCGKDGSYTIPDGVTSVVRGVFWGAHKLKSVVIPASVTSIADEAFVNYYYTIFGYADTTAETYANKNDIPFVDLNNISFNSTVTATAGLNNISLSWNKVNGATGYLVKSADGETQYTADAITKTSYNITGLESGTQYQFRVYALINGKWYDSSAVTATTVEVFKNLTATAGVGQITLNWDKITDATGYVVKSADGKTQYTRYAIKNNSYNVTGLESGTNYQFKVYAYVNGKWYSSPIISETAEGFENVTATAGNGRIILNWDKVAGATGYVVKSADGKTQYTRCAIRDNSYNVTGLESGTKYQFKVYAYVKGKWCDSPIISGTPVSGFKNITAVAGNGKIDLTWNKVNNATGYVVKSADGKIQYTKNSIHKSAYTVTGLKNGTQYKFKVYAKVNREWYASNIISKTPVAKPQNVKATAGNAQVKLTWDTVNGATGYLVKSADGAVQYTADPITENTYTVTGLTNGKQYKFKVYAYVDGLQFASASVSKTPVAKPTNVVAVAGKEKITLAWDKVDGATAYQIKSADGTILYTADNITETIYTVKKLDSNTTYKFKVYAYADGKWYASSTVSKTTFKSY